MKKHSIRVAAACLAVLLLLLVPVNAAVTASDYISGYFIDVYIANKNQVKIEFSVSATGKMTKAGAYEIRIYEQQGTKWALVETMDEFSDGMTDTNCYGFTNTVTYTGLRNTRYKVAVTIFARDATGSDSRTETHYATTK